MAEQEVLYPDAHVFFNRGSVQNEPDVTKVIITQISLKEGIKKLGEKVRGAVHSEIRNLHMRDTFIFLHRKSPHQDTLYQMNYPHPSSLSHVNPILL